jgi:hypothetical protein
MLREQTTRRFSAPNSRLHYGAHPESLFTRGGPVLDPVLALCLGTDKSHVQTLVIYKLGSDQNYDTFT